MIMRSKTKQYALVGVLSLAAISSAILLPEYVKLLSLGFLSPLAIQIYYLYKDKK